MNTTPRRPVKQASAVTRRRSLFVMRSRVSAISAAITERTQASSVPHFVKEKALQRRYLQGRYRPLLLLRERSGRLVQTPSVRNAYGSSGRNYAGVGAVA